MPLTDREFLGEAWARYRQDYVHADGYVLDRTRGGGEVTSEGQSYALLRAAWSGDERTFVRVLAWTEARLRRSDGLYSWRWAPARGGEILDANAATDADQDVAFALVVAADRFERPGYLERARELVRAIRLHASIRVADGWFPAAGNWAIDERIVNLSYFVPYAYPYFDLLDPNAGWLEVIPRGYRLLHEVTAGQGRLPPDFMSLSTAGEPSALPASSTLPSRFSFDAVRVYWRVAADCRLHRRSEACGYPGAQAIEDLLARSGRLVTQYDLDSTARSTEESPMFYASVLPLLEDRAPETADRIRREKLSLRQMQAMLDRADRYYDLNWVWFGFALSSGLVGERTPPLNAVSGLLASVGR